MSTPAPTNPFPGLRPFRGDEEHLFFGREDQVDAMVDKLAETHFLGVLGTSGSGKSSLVNCGLRPALHQGLMAAAGPAWRVAQFRPGGNPIGAMARTLAADGVLFRGFESTGMPLVDIVETTLRMSKRGLVDILEQAQLPAGTNLLVVVDQFEELFRYRYSDDGDESTSHEESVAFVNLLLQVRQRCDLPVFVVLTMRSDFIGDCTQFAGLAEAINDGQYLVPRMSRGNRRAAITGPVGVSGAEMNPVLLTRLVNDVGDNPDQLSILQHALNRTFAHWAEAGDDAPIGLTHYEAIGTMEHALDQHAEQAYSELKTERQQRICEKLFRALTDKATDPRGIRRPTPFAALCALIGAEPAEVAAVIDVFRDPSRSFLMPPAGDALEPDSIVDISHETLMRVWRRLGTWANEEAASARMYKRLAETAELHAANKAGLWRNPDLRLALDWCDHDRPNAAWAARYDSHFDAAMGFLTASREAHEAEIATEEDRRQRELEAEREKARAQAKHARRMRLAAVISGCLAIAAVIAGFYAESQSRKARQNLVAASLLTGRSEMVHLRVSRGLLAYGRALELLPADDPKRRAVRGLIASWAHRTGMVLPHSREVYALSFSSDGTLLATVGADGSAVIWDAATGTRRWGPLRHADVDERIAEGPVEEGSDNEGSVSENALPIDVVAFSPGGHTLATSAFDGSVRLWNGDTGLLIRELGEIDNHTLVFSADGTLLATADHDGAGLWDVASGERRAFFPDEEGLPRDSEGTDAVALDPNGDVLAAAFRDGTLRLFDIATGKPRREPIDIGSWMSSLAFSPDGRLLAIGCEDDAAILWNVAEDALLKRFEHDDPVADVAFSPDGALLATACFDNAARLFDVTALEPRGEPLPHTDDVHSVAFSADGSLLVSIADDHQALVWEAATGAPFCQPLTHEMKINDAAFNPVDNMLATASDDETVALWSMEPNLLRGAPFQHAPAKPDGDDDRNRRVHTAAPSPDGRWLVTAGGGRVLVWDLEEGGTPDEVTQTEAVLSAVLSRDGTQLATASVNSSESCSVRVWGLTDGAWTQTTAPIEVDAFVSDVDIGPDGTTLVTATWSDNGEQSETQMWRLEGDTWTKHGAAMDHASPVVAVAYSPDGSKLATACAQRTAHVWNVADQKQLGVAMRHRDTVTAVAFSPDGRTLATACDDNAARLWDVESQTQLGDPLRHPDDVNDVAFSPDGSLLATAGEDGIARIWCLVTRHERGETIRHDDTVRCVAFVSDGTALATGSDDGTAAIWNVTPPCIDEPDRLRASIEVQTCGAIDSDGTMRPLTVEEVAERRGELEALGGPAFVTTWDKLSPADREQLEAEVGGN